MATEKLTRYCLDDGHPRGKHKARVFRAALGLTAENAPLLAKALLAAASAGEAEPVERIEFGTTWAVDFWMEYAGRRALIRSYWLEPADGGVPRFTTCFVVR